MPDAFLSSVVRDLLVVPTPHERLPLALLQRLVRHGWRDLCVCHECGLEDQLEEPHACGSARQSSVSIPAWGPGVVTLLLGVANWGVAWDGAPIPPDPVKTGRDAWGGPAHQSGKHLLDGSSAHPYGGFGICHLDSGGLLDAYERWGWPEGASRGDHLVAFDYLRKAGGPRWRAWLAWSDALLARPELHEWLIGYWLREFWTPSWQAFAASAETVERLKGRNPPYPTLGWQIRNACVNVRIRNSAKGWATKWQNLSTEDQASTYVAAKRATRGEGAAKRAERQVRFAQRAAAAIEAVRMEMIP